MKCTSDSVPDTKIRVSLNSIHIDYLMLTRQNSHLLMKFHNFCKCLKSVKFSKFFHFFFISAFRKVLLAPATDSAFFQTIFFEIYRTLLRVSPVPQKKGEHELYRGTIYKFVRKSIYRIASRIWNLIFQGKFAIAKTRNKHSPIAPLIWAFRIAAFLSRCTRAYARVRD